MVGLKHKNNLIPFLEKLKNWFFSKTNNSNSKLEEIFDLFQEKENEKYSKFFLLKKIENYKFSCPTLKIESIQKKINSITDFLPKVYHLVFINGYFSKDLSDKNIGFWKIKVHKKPYDLFLSNPIQQEFLHLIIDLFSQEKTKIYLPEKCIAQKPLYILHINQGSKEKNTLNIIQNSCEIYLEKQSEGSIIEHFLDISSSQEEEYFSGLKNVLYIKEKSKLQYVQIFSQKKGYHALYNDFHMEDNAITNMNIFSLSSEFLFHQVNVKFNKKEAKFSNMGLSIVSKYNTHNVQSYIEHNAESCISEQIHKIVALDNGIGIFDGLIKINQHAKKSYADVISNNLILSKNSKIYSQPKLEIYMDEVKCKHAITVGKIDENQIFYFTSRGIKYKSAEKIIMFSFIFTIIESVFHAEIKNIIINKINEFL